MLSQEPDLNRRPSGYEPDKLPTALPCDFPDHLFNNQLSFDQCDSVAGGSLKNSKVCYADSTDLSVIYRLFIQHNIHLY